MAADIILEQTATGAKFQNYFNVPGRTIVAVSNFSPVYRLKQNYALDGQPLPLDLKPELPIVSRWSDVTWIIWETLSRQAGAKPENLK